MFKRVWLCGLMVARRRRPARPRRGSPAIGSVVVISYMQRLDRRLPASWVLQVLRICGLTGNHQQGTGNRLRRDREVRLVAYLSAVGRVDPER